VWKGVAFMGVCELVVEVELDERRREEKRWIFVEMWMV
jgi:hypothetical protein